MDRVPAVRNCPVARGMVGPLGATTPLGCGEGVRCQTAKSSIVAVVIDTVERRRVSGSAKGIYCYAGVVERRLLKVEGSALAVVPAGGVARSSTRRTRGSGSLLRRSCACLELADARRGAAPLYSAGEGTPGTRRRLRLVSGPAAGDGGRRR